MNERFYAANIEGLTDWNIREQFWLAPDGTRREFGLSAMIRLRNEAEWIIPSLESIAGWVDEIVITLQGDQTDGTDLLVEDWAKDRDNVFIYSYPFLSYPNGPGHDKQPRGSLHERAMFYNWSLAKTRFSHVMKHDGDMVAFDWLGPVVRDWMKVHDPIRFRGVDICGRELTHKSIRPYTANEVRVFRVTEKTFYYSAANCESLTYGHRDGPAIPGNAYLHFKWAKNLDSATKAWPADWRKNSPHYQSVFEKATPGELYRGEWPSVLKDRRPCIR